jgi:ABC-type histidine transport system ATPase subunit
MPEPAIAIRDLHKSYGSFNVVNGVSLTVEQGDV